MSRQSRFRRKFVPKRCGKCILRQSNRRWKSRTERQKLSSGPKNGQSTTSLKLSLKLLENEILTKENGYLKDFRKKYKRTNDENTNCEEASKNAARSVEEKEKKPKISRNKGSG